MAWTIKNKLFLGFGLVLLVVVLGAVNTFYQIQKVRTTQDSVISLRQPTVMAGMRMTDGMHLSLAGLRGYMILGGDSVKAELFKAERARGWVEIDAALAEFDHFSKSWTAPENVERLKKMKVLVEDFRIAQQEVEAIAHTDENIPSFKVLLTEAAPRAQQILAAITAMIDEEGRLEATVDRKHMLKLMADSRGSFAVGLANIRAYLLSGDVQFRDGFEAKWQLNQVRLAELNTYRSLFSPIQAKAWADYNRGRQAFAPLPIQMFDSRASEQWNLANYWLGTKAAPKASAIMVLLEEMRGSQESLAALDVSELQSRTDNLTQMAVIVSLLAIVIGLVVSVLFGRAISTSLKIVGDRAKKIASGDLSQPDLIITSKDELGELNEAINEMSHGLSDVVSNVNEATRELGAASHQLSETSSNTNAVMAAQQSETAQVATAMNEMSATVQEVAQNASDAAISAGNADQRASEGKVVVEVNMSRIRELADEIGKASETINRLGEDTEGVDDIVGVISDIAEQTNLLALNAAIEAARAGDQGRGFAVVADEVRTLAARTQESTVKISSMLGRLKGSASEAVLAMQQGYDKASSSVDGAKAASDSLEAITLSVAEINSMNVQIAAASEEQSTVAEEMNRSIIKINDEAERTLDNTQETDAAADQINQLSSKLQSAMGRFKLD